MIRAFLTRKAASFMAKRGAEKRRRADREKVLAKAREMRSAMGSPADPRLA